MTSETPVTGIPVIDKLVADGIFESARLVDADPADEPANLGQGDLTTQRVWLPIEDRWAHVPVVSGGAPPQVTDEAVNRRRPADCTGASGLRCTVADHDHTWDDEMERQNPEVQEHSAEGEMLCNDCNRPCFYDRSTEMYWHTEAYTPECFLIPYTREFGR